jgi:hypothetical protein
VCVLNDDETAHVDQFSLDSGSVHNRVRPELEEEDLLR